MAQLARRLFQRYTTSSKSKTKKHRAKDSSLVLGTQLTSDSTGYNLYEQLESVASTPEIRLITIEPSDDTSEVVRCTLSKKKLGSNCQYSALSYVWSDPPGKSRIILNGAEFEVTKNLELALQHVRDRTCDIFLWVDALCINQADTAECSNQVMIMDKIFTNAKNVFCWIGEAQDGSDLVLAVLDTSELEHSTGLPVDEGRNIDRRFLEESLDANTCAALKHFGTRPYWSRTWIMQEFLLASQLVILYGSISLPWQTLYNLSFFHTMLLTNPALNRELLSDAKKSDALEKFGFSTHTFIHNRNHYKSPTWRKESLLSLVVKFRTLNATDKRDKIYGFYGLAAEGNRDIIVDYSKPVSHVYANFARTHIERTGSLNIILDAGFQGSSNGQTLNLPSWIPDWSTQEITPGPSLRNEVYSTAQQTIHSTLPSHINNILCVRAIRSGKVTVFKADLSFWGLEDLLFLAGPNEYPSGTPRLQALFRTLTADRYHMSNTRLDDDPNLWFYHLTFGFFLDLGIQTNYQSSYALSAMSGLEISDAMDSNLLELDSQHQPASLPQHDFIVAFRDWAESCIKILDDMIRRKCAPLTRENGAIMSKTLYKRLEPWRFDDEHPPKSAISNVDNLLCWKEYLATARNCFSIETVMEIFLGVRFDADTEARFGAVRTTHGVACWSRYRTTISAVCGSSSLFATDSGYIGAGPNTLRAEDDIFVLHDCSLPVVLRRVGDQYTFIGKCFVHGLMDGEAIELSDSGKLAVQDLEIV